LAKEQKDYAVLNLIRRATPIIAHEEYLELFDGKTALGWAMVHENHDLAKELLFKQTLAQQVLSPPNKSFPTFLADCESDGFPNIGDFNYKWLLKRELAGFADFWVTDYESHLYLKRIVQRIDTTVNIYDKGWTLLLSRLSNFGDDDTELLKPLLALGSNPNVVLPDGTTALHVCAENGRSGSINVLLDCRADVRHFDLSGNTALDHAAKYDNDAKNGKSVCIVVCLLIMQLEIQN
jgi:hypothetical protein